MGPAAIAPTALADGRESLCAISPFARGLAIFYEQLD